MTPAFDHEKLDVYRLAIDFTAWTGKLLESHPIGSLSAAKQLDRASTSTPLNIAEGNGKRSIPDRARYLQIARGSALECAACLDVLIARERLTAREAEDGKAMLVRIVSMLSKLIYRRGHEAGA